MNRAKFVINIKKEIIIIALYVKIIICFTQTQIATFANMKINI